MRFTKEQYQEAVKRLNDGLEQLEPDANPCSICGDSGHVAYECGFNPLVAMALCEELSSRSDGLHQILHWLGGYETAFGNMCGPAKVMMPDSNPESYMPPMPDFPP